MTRRSLSAFTLLLASVLAANPAVSDDGATADTGPAAEAEDESDRLASSLALVFTERRNGATRFRRLVTNRYGGLDEWPRGFFDEAAHDARDLLEAGLRKREAEGQ